MRVVGGGETKPAFLQVLYTSRLEGAQKGRGEEGDKSKERMREKMDRGEDA